MLGETRGALSKMGNVQEAACVIPYTCQRINKTETLAKAASCRQSSHPNMACQHDRHNLSILAHELAIWCIGDSDDLNDMESITNRFCCIRFQGPSTLSLSGRAQPQQLSKAPTLLYIIVFKAIPRTSANEHDTPSGLDTEVLYKSLEKVPW